MKLLPYKKKRNFDNTPEPQELPRFCVQKHAASHLHYDFRLEYKGVLLSWAVPKGPSMNPKDKRLAIKVEDHPLAYQYFEGVIPKGNYGAGTVEIWDAGTFYTPGSHTIKKGLAKGHLHFVLNGKKLKGEFNLICIDDKNWLLIKQAETLIPPMLATLIKEPFDDPEWLFEIKWDGYRALSYIRQNQAKILSRTNKNMNAQFPLLIKDLKKVKDSVILDGEIVVLDESGKSNFQGSGALCYYVFDILFKDEQDLRDLPLISRKKILKKWINPFSFSHIRYCDHVLQKGKAFFKTAVEHELEGIIGKKISSTYQSKRSADWVKIKSGKHAKVVIGGFSAPKGSRKKFGALLVGVYNDKKELVYAGRIGGGFTDSELDALYKKMLPLIQEKCPFKDIPPSKDVQWIKPKIMCEVHFSEWTKAKSMRHPIFGGLCS